MSEKLRLIIEQEIQRELESRNWGPAIEAIRTLRKAFPSPGYDLDETSRQLENLIMQEPQNMSLRHALVRNYYESRENQDRLFELISVGLKIPTSNEYQFLRKIQLLQSGLTYIVVNELFGLAKRATEWAEILNDKSNVRPAETFLCQCSLGHILLESELIEQATALFKSAKLAADQLVSDGLIPVTFSAEAYYGYCCCGIINNEEYRYELDLFESYAAPLLPDSTTNVGYRYYVRIVDFFLDKMKFDEADSYLDWVSKNVRVGWHGVELARKRVATMRNMRTLP